MKTGIELFKLNDQNISSQFEQFQREFGFEVPPLYKAFISLFKIGRGLMSPQIFLHPNEDLKLEMGVLHYNGEHSNYIGLYDLFSVEECIQAKNNAFDPDDDIWKLNLVPIGECFSNNILMMGVGLENRDKIYLENSNLFVGDKRLLFICNDIFEFLRNLCLKDEESPGYGVRSYDQLYKNWGEDFWRVRE